MTRKRDAEGDTADLAPLSVLSMLRDVCRAAAESPEAEQAVMREQKALLRRHRQAARDGDRALRKLKALARRGQAPD